MAKCKIYPVFLPQWGCPQQCVYCNQRSSTSGAGAIEAGESMLAVVEDRIVSLAREARVRNAPGELAFYGGTFTALPGPWMEKLLHKASGYVESGVFSGIRFSTRPDAVPRRICRNLSRFPVRTVELGVQSLSDDVLLQSRRGYSAGDVARAVGRIRESGWKLGLQLMPGLPGDNCGTFLESVKAAVDLSPDFVRIYPTLVLRDTTLSHWLSNGKYVPLTLDEAVDWCTAALEQFEAHGIAVIRLGLHPDPGLLKPGVVLGGPVHPAFGYLVRVHLWRDRVDQWFIGNDRKLGSDRAVLRVAHQALSEVLGPSRENVSHWRRRWRLADLRVEGVPGWPPGRFEVYPAMGEGDVSHGQASSLCEAR